MDAFTSFDISLFKSIHFGLHSVVADPIFWALSYSGLGFMQALAVVLTTFRKPKSLMVPLLATLFVSGTLLADVIKVVVPRDRPSTLYGGAQEPHLYHSFPSGHTSTSFGLAFMILFMTLGTPQRKWGYWMLLYATLVGISRVYRGVHYPSDVLGGVCCGLLGASICHILFTRLGWLTGTAEGSTAHGGFATDPSTLEG